MAKQKFDGLDSVAEGFKLIKEQIYDKSYKHNGTISYTDLTEKTDLSLQQGTYVITGASDYSEEADPIGMLTVHQTEVQKGAKKVKLNFEIYTPEVEGDIILIRHREEGSSELPEFTEVITKGFTYQGARLYNPSKSLKEQVTTYRGIERLFVDSPFVIQNPCTIDLKEMNDLPANKEIRFIKFFNIDSEDGAINFIDSSNKLPIKYVNGGRLSGGPLSEARIIKKSQFSPDKGLYICISNTGDGIVFVDAPKDIDVSKFADKETVAYRKTFDAGEVTFSAPGKTIIYTNKNVDDTADKLSGKNGSAAIVTVFGNNVYVDIRNVK